VSGWSPSSTTTPTPPRSLRSTAGPDEVALVFSFDGTGYGADGTVWGGEVLLADQAEAQRHTHLATVPLPGGDAAVANPSRMALAHLWAAGLPWDDRLAPVATLTQEERRVLAHQLQREVATVPTSSAGRLFDAVSALLGVRQQITYEGQAAIELEWLADAWSQAGNADDEAPVYRFAIGGQTIDPAPVLRALTDDVIAGVDGGAIAAGFHLAVAEMIARIAEQVASSGGPRTVGLTGGVFQNAWLTTRTRQRLERIGATVLTHRQVPTNDGGLAYGQLAAVAARAPRAATADPRTELTRRTTKGTTMCLGVPGRIVAIRDEQGTPMASVDFGGIRKDVCLAYLPRRRSGTTPWSTSGSRSPRIDEESALETLELIRSIGNLAEELGEEPADPASTSDHLGTGSSAGTRRREPDGAGGGP
jgi:hydrogenase maturation factor